MNENQDKIADYILRTLGEHNSHLKESTLLEMAESSFGTGSDAEVYYVLGRLLEDYKLVYRSKSWICLTANGEVAVSMGTRKYLRKLHGNTRLDLKLKRLEIMSKWLSILKDGKSMIPFFTSLLLTLSAILYLLIWFLRQYL